MTIWQKMRYKMGLSANDMANKLNIDENKYLEIERGERELPKEHINKFLGIRNEQNMNEKEIEIYMVEVNNWLKEVNWVELEKEFGFASHNEARKAIGIAFSTYGLLRTDYEQVADKTRRKVYRFYHDELNKNINNKEPIKKRPQRNNSEDYRVVSEIDTNEFPYVKLTEDGKIDVDAILDIVGGTQLTLASMLGIHGSCISKWKIQKQLPRYGVLVKLNNVLKQYATETDVEEVVPKIDECVLNCPEEEYDVEVEIFEETIDDVVEETEKEKTTTETLQISNDYVVQLESRVRALEKTIACYEKLIERL